MCVLEAGEWGHMRGKGCVLEAEERGGVGTYEGEGGVSWRQRREEEWGVS